MEPKPEERRERGKFGAGLREFFVVSDTRPYLNYLWAVYVCAVCALVFRLFFYPLLVDQHHHSPTSACISNLKQSALSLTMYAADNDERLPPSAWMDVGKPYVKNDDVHRCPLRPTKDGYGYAMHQAMLGQKIGEESDAAAILLFDSTLMNRNAVSGIGTLPSPPRHDGMNCIAYADGHASGRHMR
jgi:prepilin-type processing-associated H-X9-DG protein